MAYPRFLRARAHKFVKRSTNAAGGDNYSVTSTTFAELDSTNLRIAIPAQVADVIELNFQGLTGNEAQVLDSDFATIVSGAIVNRVAGTTQGIASGYGPASTYTPLTIIVPYTVVAGDIVSGKVTFSPVFRIESAGSRTIWASSTGFTLQFVVKNLGPVAPH